VIDPGTALGKRDLGIMGLLLVNGLRTIEVSRATIGDIHEIDGIPVLKVHGKGGKLGDAKLRDDVYAAIQAYLVTRDHLDPASPLFLSIGNLAKGRISPKTVQARVRHYLRLAGIQKPHLTAHSLRHTCAVLTLSIGKADLVQVQRLLRHSDPKVTMRYVRSLDWLRDNAVDRNPISL
jgi:integrase